ncbi:protein kinase [Trichothermofontia sichuanensis B231]|uniref:protein kinase domain-containing protein n=1 Tax=Trichothermofontia sichuanensis TaxID=3045816 RepID=UPI002247D4A5|nr:protein kinase [Trichothermofontia sichuanensis]UZQ56362.1 protein kinase [Trichothermofontia sichuanensis B231]
MLTPKSQKNQFFCLLMELAEGSLEQRLDWMRRNFNRDEARRLLTDLTAGLLYLHSSDPQRVHWDLTPANIFGVGDRWKIGDFGLTRLIQSQQG